MLGLYQAFRLDSSTWVPPNGWLPGICQCDGKNESLSLAQDTDVLQPVLNRAVRQYKCSNKAWVWAIYLKNKFSKRARLLRTALWFL